MRAQVYAVPEPVRARAQQLAGALLQSAAGIRARAAAAAAAEGVLRVEPALASRLQVARSLLESIEYVRVVAIIHDLLLHFANTAVVVMWGWRGTMAEGAPPPAGGGELRGLRLVN